MSKTAAAGGVSTAYKGLFSNDGLKKSTAEKEKLLLMLLKNLEQVVSSSPAIATQAFLHARKLPP